MNRRQMQSCAARLPAHQAAAFLTLTDAADDLFLRSVELRLRAWDLYRSVTGLRKGGKPIIKASKLPKTGSATK